MSLTAAFITFGVIFLAELPDKTMVASLVMGSRFRPLYVWAGVAAAFLVHVTLAVAAGSVLTLLPHRVVDAIALVLFAAGAVLVYREGRDETETDETETETDEINETGAIHESRASDESRATGGPAVTTGAADARPSAGEPAPTEAAVVPEERERTASRGFWRVAATSFTVIFVAEMGDLTQISTANLAARFGSPVTVWLGALLALWSVAAIAIAGGRGLLRIVPVKIITRIAAAAFVILAILSLVDVIRG